VESTKQIALRSFGAISALINNRGGAPPDVSDQHYDSAWQSAFELNLLSYARTDRNQEGADMPPRKRARETLDVEIDDVKQRVAVIRGDGSLDPIVLLHGFGSTKEDYADIVHYPALFGRPFVAFDAPGCGDTVCGNLAVTSIPFLVKTATAVLERLAIRRFHIVGHSMGGLAALMLAHEQPNRILSLTSIEGNVAPEDCFISRQIFSRPADNAQAFLDGLIERMLESTDFSCPLYAVSLRHKVKVDAVRGIFTSMVALSDHGDLLSKFLLLPCPKMFMHGEQNAGLSYLPLLRAHGVTVTSIPRSGHFPMYSNPVEMWAAIAAFCETSDCP
jgi:pimeloyl-ACP methyl ester carboxylesterase